MKINEKEKGIGPYFQKRFENYSISLSLYFSLTFLFDLLRCNFVLIFQPKNGPSPASFLFIFDLFQANIHTIWQQINVKKCPSSIWHWDSNPRPSESPPMTTRPGSRPKIYFSSRSFKPWTNDFEVIHKTTLLFSHSSSLTTSSTFLSLSFEPVFKNGPIPASFLFIFVLFKHKCHWKTVDVSGIQTRIVGMEDEPPLPLQSRFFLLFILPSYCFIIPPASHANSNARMAFN